MTGPRPRRIAGAPLLAILLVTGGGFSLPPGPAAAQEPSPPLPGSFEDPMPLYSVGLGPYSRPVTTSDPEGQAFFDQGVQLMYAFTPEDAARSFREAWKRDPSCAMCYWGEAWAWGPYLNGDMRPEDAPRAWAAAREALRLADEHATPVERVLIEAMAVRYAPEHDASERERLDSVYADAMAEAWRAFPVDPEVGTLYGEALMLLEPRRGNWDAEDPSIQRIHGVLEAVLERDIRHPGACHLYIHATESTTVPGKARGCAEHLGTAIPGASHINHMPSHTWNRIGLWGRAVRANIRAWHSDLKAEVGEGFAIYPSHNLHMLLFAASMDGQGAVAAQAARDYAKIVDDGEFYRGLVGVRFGRFDEVLELEDRPGAPVQRGLWDFARGYAHLREGDADSAAVWLERVREAAEEGGAEAGFRGHTAQDLLGVVGGLLEGEILRSEGRLEEAVAAFERAVEIEDGLRYDEPEPLNFSSRDWLGAALLEGERFEEAEEVYRVALEDHPHNGWALHGLEEALRARGKDAEAAGVRQALEAAWARADTWLRGSRF